MWLLGKMLPLMVGHKVPEDDDHWANYLDLLDIVDYLLAPALCEDDVAIQGGLISEHHLQFKELYPGASMPRLILE